MSTLRWFWLAAVMFGAFGAVAQAADTGSAQSQVAYFFKHTAALNLSEDQRRQCDALSKEVGEKARVKGADIDAIKTEEIAQIEAILSKDQLDRLARLKESGK